MTIKKEILNILRADLPLREEIATKLNTREIYIYQWAYRQQHKKLLDFRVIDILVKRLKLKRDQIVEVL